jgi:hypothetical protein
MAYQMARQSPIIFWLLLAATLCVDAAVLAWGLSEVRYSYPFSFYPSMALYAFVLGQLSLVCIWSMLRGTNLARQLVPPIVAVFCSALLIATFYYPEQFETVFFDYTAYYSLHTALLLIALWVLQRTMFWRRYMGYAHPWQFSLTNLLTVMTAVALLSTASRIIPNFSEYGWFSLILTALPVMLAVLSIVIWIQSWHWILRLAGVVGCAIALASCTVLETNVNFAFFTSVPLLIQGLILSTWLACGPILPPSRISRAYGETGGPKPQE